MNPRATLVEYISPYQLDVTFQSGETKRFDLRPYLKYPIYQDLVNESLCSRATIQQGVVVWNDDIDLDPDTLYLESVPVSTGNFA
jgi:hypothetical protein